MNFNLTSNGKFHLITRVVDFVKKYIYKIIERIYSLNYYVRKLEYFFCKTTNRNIKIEIGNKLIKLLPKGQVSELLLTSNFEFDLLTITSKLLNNSDTVIDIGANIGIYSLLSSKIIGKKGRIYSFEPSLETYNILKKNIKLNRINNIQTHQVALAEKKGIMKLISEKRMGDAYRFLERTITNQVYESGENVIVSTIDSYFESFERNISMIKIDVEGGELNVLMGGINTIMKNKNVIILVENSVDGLTRSGRKQNDMFIFLKKMNLEIIAWDNNIKKWIDDESAVKMNGNIWACNKNQIKILRNTYSDN